ncbi:MAG: DNA topoisomerase IV subunit A [Rhodocyclaceae bacterium]|nr:DNA topoisomerase IV subunit A [Rhodocyclaceae bacterium]
MTTPDLFDSLPPPPPTAPSPSFAEDALPLAEFAERAYLAYAISVVKGRALPQVEDGLKPVQRRLLYAMHELRLSPGAKPVKSARVVGDVIGKFHPHGDASVYETLVRVAQDFALRYPLIEGQGNFGSRDGDAPAAMRYTECRLAPIADLLLAELSEGAVDFAPNYDGSLNEPKLLPARLPFVLLNGASGIAVGMATEIPPHNLHEVAEAVRLLLKKPAATLEEVLAILPGPDFPGGGHLISPPETIRELYASGRGSLRMRARWRLEELARGQWRVIVHELPHGVSCAQVLAEIEALINPQPRAGKKEVSPEQRNLRQALLAVLEAARDESNEKEPVRLVLEPRSSRLKEDELMAPLLAHTSLECNVPVNLTLIGRDGRPAQKGLLAILSEWLDFRRATVERRTRRRLAVAEQRLHILEGRLIAFLSIDEVIRTIREAEDPKRELIARFGLSETQAEDILEIRLRQLARLEGVKLEEEKRSLIEEIAAMRRLLDDAREIDRVIDKEIAADAKKYGDARRTLIAPVAPMIASVVALPDEAVTVIVSKNGWARTRQGHGVDPATITYKSGDFPLLVAESRTLWPLVILDDHGRAYTVRVAELPGGRGDGVPLTTFIDFQEGGRLVEALSDAPEALYLFANSGGYGFLARVADLMSRVRSGKAFMTLAAGEKLLTPQAADGEEVAILTMSNRLLVFPKSELKMLPKGRGVKLIELAPGDAVIATACSSTGFLLEGKMRGGNSKTLLLRDPDLAPYRAARGRRGKPIAASFQATKLSAATSLKQV